MNRHGAHESLDDSDESLIAAIADEYCDRLARGEVPDVEGYARRHPHMAGAVRHVLAALKLMRLSDSSPVGDLLPLEAGVAGQLGDFQILHEIGRGGMGIVYEAEQISLNRRVALKILPFAAALDATRLERFKYEAQAAARLHHSNIVPVYSVGCERGVYYYAMQYIDGQSLARAIEQWRFTRRAGDRPGGSSMTGTGGTLADEPSAGMNEHGADAQHGAPDHRGYGKPPATARRPPATGTRDQAALSTLQSAASPRHIETVVNLAIQAAEALQSAHEMGIVHRDIKPGNLLVDVRGHLWITDFGLARFKTGADLTATGNLVGTLRYMSPEQALPDCGPVDHRTDIYSLAATTYEMLTLEPVLQSETQPQMLDELRTKEPRSLRKCNAAVPADLETIVLKGLSKDPADRYGSAQEMGDDFRRFLNHQPIRAKRPTLLERAVKWSRRHRSVVGTAVALLVLAVAGLTASIVLLAREQSKTEEALTLLQDKHVALVGALEAEETQRLSAQRNFQQAHEMLDFFIHVAEEDMGDDPAVSELRAKMLQAGLEYYQRFIDQQRDDPHIRAELAESHLHIAHILHETDKTTAATAAMEDACRIYEQLVRDFPDQRRYRFRLTWIYRDLGILQGRDRLRVLDERSVQQHLHLSDEQQQRIELFLEQEDDVYDRIRDSADPREMRAELQKHMAATIPVLEQLLSAQQFARLEQICLQQRGVRALSDQQVIVALGLTASQQRQIAALQAELRMSRRERSRKHDGFQSELSRIDDFLTPTQRAKWQELIGEEFTGRLRCRSHRQKDSRSKAERSSEQSAAVLEATRDQAIGQKQISREKAAPF